MLMSVRDMDVLRLLCWCQNVRPDDLSSISTETERENLITLGLIKRHQRSDTLLLTNSGRAFLQAALEGDVPNLTLSYHDAAIERRVRLSSLMMTAYHAGINVFTISKLIEKIEDRLANKWGCWYERNKARVPLYAVLGGIGWYLYGMFLNSLKLGKESVFNTTGEVIESIWVFNPFKNLFAVFTPFGLGVSAFIALMVCLITKKGYSWFSGYKFTRDARGFDILPDGTHGTSGFATKKELAEHLELGSAEEVTGMLLGRIKARPDDPEKYATYVAHRMKPGENNNILCIGAPGSYKSRGFIIPFLMGCAQRSSGGHHESVVVTDPKGELFENLAPYFREHGFYVKAVNFLDMAHSDGWNCLAGLEANPDLVTTVANTIIQNTSGPKEADDFWSRAELNLLMALIHYVCNLKDARGNLLPLEQRSLGDVYKILAYKSVNEINRILAELPPEHPAKGPHGLFLKARENLWGNISIPSARPFEGRENNAAIQPAKVYPRNTQGV